MNDVQGDGVKVRGINSKMRIYRARGVVIAAGGIVSDNS